MDIIISFTGKYKGAEASFRWNLTRKSIEINAGVGVLDFESITYRDALRSVEVEKITRNQKKKMLDFGFDINKRNKIVKVPEFKLKNPKLNSR